MATLRPGLRVAVAQICSGTDPQLNLGLVADIMRNAAAADAQLVVFPEATMRCFGANLAEVAEPLDGPWAAAVGSLAAAHRLTAVAGMFTPAEAGRVHNTLLVTDGAAVTGYDKIHLYDAFGFAESNTVAAGATAVVVEVAGVLIGLSTCYDLRFPTLYTRLADDGAAVTVVAASWGAGPGKVEQWDVLTRARALDSGCFLLAADQADPAAIGGSDCGRAPTGVGYSRVVGPTGQLLGALGAEPGMLVADLDLAAVPAAREATGVLANRR